MTSFLWFLYHTQRHITIGRTPLDEWSIRRRDLYLTTHYTHNRQTSMPPVGFETHDLSRRATADLRLIIYNNFVFFSIIFTVSTDTELINSDLLSPTIYIAYSARRFFKIHLVLFPKFRTATSVLKTILGQCNRIIGCNSNFHCRDSLWTKGVILNFFLQM